MLHADLPPIVLTRPLRQSLGFDAELRARFGAGLDIVISPLTEIEVLPQPTALEEFDSLAFTSQNGVFAWQNWEIGSPKRAYCVGDKTASLAREAGLDAISAGGDIAALNALILQNPVGRLLHISGAEIAGSVPGATRLVAYRQVAVAATPQLNTCLSSEQALLVPLFSPKSAERFDQILSPSTKAQLHALCLSQNSAKKLTPSRFERIEIAQRPTAKAILDKMSEMFPP